MKPSDLPPHGVVDPRTPDLRMRDALAYFVRRPSVIGLLTLLTGSLVARVWVGDVSRWDLLLAASLVLHTVLVGQRVGAGHPFASLQLGHDVGEGLA